MPARCPKRTVIGRVGITISQNLMVPSLLPVITCFAELLKVKHSAPYQNNISGNCTDAQ